MVQLWNLPTPLRLDALKSKCLEKLRAAGPLPSSDPAHYYFRAPSTDGVSVLLVDDDDLEAACRVASDSVQALLVIDVELIGSWVCRSPSQLHACDACVNDVSQGGVVPPPPVVLLVQMAV